jgi:hypothetical protein
MFCVLKYFERFGFPASWHIDTIDEILGINAYNKKKTNTMICVGHHYAQTNTNNVTKT